MNTANLTKLNELNTQINQLTPLVKDEFKENLKSFFVGHPTVESIRMGLNNHEFNDGDATQFSLYWEDAEISLTDGSVLVAPSYLVKKDDWDPILRQFRELFDAYETVLENVYGDAYESVEINRKDLSV